MSWSRHAEEAETLLRDAADQAPRATTQDDQMRLLLLVLAANAHATLAQAKRVIG